MYRFVMIGLLCLSIEKSLTCPIFTFGNMTVQSDFSLHNFLGTWYQIKWFTNVTEYESDFWNDYSQTYELENNSNTHLLVYGKARLSSEEKCFSFGPWLILANNSAKMILEKKDLNTTTNLNWYYYILKTDYNHYALIYSCIEENLTIHDHCKQPILWIFSRTNLLSNEYLIELDNYIENTLCMNLIEFEITLHSEKSCHLVSSLGQKKLLFINMNWLIIFYLFYILFLTYK